MKNECGKIIFRYSEKRRKNDMDPLMSSTLVDNVKFVLYCMIIKLKLI